MIDDTEIDDCVDSIVAACNGDLRGALTALMLVNEQLEQELQRISAMTRPSTTPMPGKALH